VLNSAASDQLGEMKNRALYHVEWCRRFTKAFLQRQTTAGAIALGDLVVPLKMAAFWPLVVVDAQYTKTGVVDLDTGEAKYFGVTYVTRLQQLRTSH
jgi:hypothetical protein